MGLKTEDPAKWMALSPEDFAKKKKASLEDIKKHWTAKGDILHNDGHGLYLTTEKYYGDFELLVDYKTVAKADSGIYLRGFPKSKFGTTRRRVENGRLVRTRDPEVFGTIARVSPERILVLADNPLVSGTVSLYPHGR